MPQAASTEFAASLTEMRMTMKLPSIRHPATLIAAAVAILASGGFGGVAPAATGGPASPPHPALYPYPDAGTVSSAPLLAPDASGGIVSADTCTPYVDGDYAHLSSGDVSAHGWWYQGTCPNTKATVTVYLYEYFSDGTWHYQASGSKYVYPGGGSVNRAVARQVCEGVAPASWRTLITVSIGTGASAYTAVQNLNCTHW